MNHTPAWRLGVFYLLIAMGPVAPAAAQSTVSPDYPPEEQYWLRLQYREYRPDITGETRKGFAGVEGSRVDLADDLGFVDDRTFDARGVIQFRPGKKLRGSYTPLDYQGDEEVRATFTYGQTRFERGTRVRSSVKGAYYSLDYEWDFIRRPRGFLGAIIGAKAFDVDTVVNDVFDLAREVDTYRVPIPVLGLTGRAYYGRFSFEFEASGLTVGERGHLYDVDGGGRFHISDRLAASVGYRLLRLKGREDLDEVDLRLGGWQFGVEVSL